MPDKWKIFATLFGTVYFGDVHLKNSQKQINTRWRIQYFGEKMAEMLNSCYVSHSQEHVFRQMKVF